ncbi:MmgE/PrpD family protein [Actinomadura luteofluorescens]|uniref:MmgE/PrpD family protein n=1 Tax=Actinomadura luteofluorescens TaxID=46163 RepID=UPI003D8C856F
MTASLTEQVENLVTRAAALTPAGMPDDVLDHVGLVLADSVGVMAAGARTAEVVALAADPSLGLGRDPAPGTARTLVPGGGHGPPATVAWLNGTAGTFLELDEGFRPTGHPAIHVVPAALAVAEATGAGGAELATAIAAGYEVAARLFECFALPRSMHPHGHFGAIGAATAVAMLTRLDPVALVRIAGTQPLLTGWEACYEGATARNTWSGHANRAGVLAGVLHRAGFTGSLTSHMSVVEQYAASPGVLAGPVDGETLRIRRNYFKFHSACALNHSVLDALLAAWAEFPVKDPWAVRRIEVTTVTANLRIDRLPEPNALSTRFSLPYAVAAALLTGSTRPASFEWDGRVAEFARRVTVAADPAMDALWPARAPARVVIRTASESRGATVSNPRGHHSRPVTREELRDKFVSLLTDDSGPEPGGSPGRPGELSRCFDALAAVARFADCAALPLPSAER